MHYLARLSRFGDERNLSARFFPDQQVVHRGKRQETWDGGVVFIDTAIGKNQQTISRSHRQRRSLAQFIKRALQSGFSLACAEERGQRGSKQISSRHATQLFQLAIGQQGVLQLQHVAILRACLENVALAANVADERHHHFFANGIDWRIRHLCEQLFEVIE